MGGAMSPERQDRAAYLLARRRGVDLNTAALTRENVALLAPEWASLPTMQGVSYYGQPVKSFESLTNFSNMTPPQEPSQRASQSQEPPRSQRSISPEALLLLQEGLEKTTRNQERIEEQLNNLNKSRIKSGLVEEPTQETVEVVVAEDDSQDRADQQFLQGLLRASMQQQAESRATEEQLANAMLSARSAFRGGKSVI